GWAIAVAQSSARRFPCSPVRRSRRCSPGRQSQRGSRPAVSAATGLPRSARFAQVDSLRYLANQPETDTGAAVVALEAIPIRGADEVGLREPGAAAQFVLGAVAGGLCRSVNGCALVVIGPAILGPLENVAEHVVQAERVFFKRSHRRRLHEFVGAGQHRPTLV